MTTETPIHTHAETIYIDAPPAKVWGLVTAMERYGEWSPENQGGYWRKRENGDVCTGEVGDEFVGINRRGEQEWKALVEIVERDEEKSFAFMTGGAANNWIQWGYRLEPDGSGTRLTEHWELRNVPPGMAERGESEIEVRRSNAIDSIGRTLAAMKAAAES